MDYKIRGLKLVRQSLDNPKYRYVTYKSWFCQMTIATDDWGTQLCHNGVFFGSSFRNVEEGVEFLRMNVDIAKPFFRKVYFHSLRYMFSKRHLTYLYWKVRHHFDPTFYLGGKK